MSIVEEIREDLLARREETYREFQAKLMPTVPFERVIGIRTPILRKLAKEYAKREGIEEFLDSLPHEYYEENNLHAFILETIKDYEECIARLNQFLPYVDNWATCDCMSPKVLGKNREKLAKQGYKWLQAKDVYTVRFGIGLFMGQFLDQDFKLEYAERISKIRSDEYYINMMVAWYFATALAKQYETILPFFTTQTLDAWTHNKAIQKAIESNRISSETKAYLRTLKIS